MGAFPLVWRRRRRLYIPTPGMHLGLQPAAHYTHMYVFGMCVRLHLLFPVRALSMSKATDDSNEMGFGQNKKAIASEVVARRNKAMKDAEDDLTSNGYSRSGLDVEGHILTSNL